jgi:hypothetical protein
MATTQHTSVIPVVDFRRQSMVLEWRAMNGTWTPCDVPPALVHGVALIRAGQPNICLYGRGGRLHLQIGADQFNLVENSLRVKYGRGLATMGLRRRFRIESDSGNLLYSHSYWASQGDEFFQWLTARAANPEWRATNGRRWSDGVEAAVLRAS